MIRGVLGSRASIGGPLGSGRGGAAAAWYLAGGVSAANCVAAYQPIGAASLAASYTNLANPGTYNAAPGTAPTFDTATGWTFNGSTQYLTTGIAPASAWSVLVRFSNITNAKAIIGSVNTSAPATRYYIYPAHASGPSVRYGNGGGVNVVALPVLTSGVLGMAGQSGYRNGVFDVAIPPDGTNFLAAYIGASNNDGTATEFLAGKIQAVAIYNTTLDAATIAAISSAMAAL